VQAKPLLDDACQALHVRKQRLLVDVHLEELALDLWNRLYGDVECLTPPSLPAATRLGGFHHLDKRFVKPEVAFAGVRGGTPGADSLDVPVHGLGQRLLVADLGLLVAFYVVSLLAIASFSSVFTAILYHDLRAVKDGIGIGQIASVFD
jgi:hypothetical protein